MRDLSTVCFLSQSSCKRRLIFFLRLDIRTWHANVEQHASEGVDKILIGNKCDWDDKRVSWTSRSCYRILRSPKLIRLGNDTGHLDGAGPRTRKRARRQVLRNFSQVQHQRRSCL